MSSLKQIQERMAAAVMHPLTRQETMVRRRRDGATNETEAGAIIRPNDRLSSFERLEIYNRQYWFRLYTSFEEDFPGLAAIVGRRQFEGLMRAYLTDHPSTSFTLRNLGSELISWLALHPEWVEPRNLLAMDMVQLEWAHIEAFDGADLPRPTPESFAAADDTTCFKLQPWLRMLELHYPVDDLLIEVRNEAGSSDGASNNALVSRRTRIVRKASALHPEQIFLAVHRQQNSIYYRRLDAEEFRMLTAFDCGRSLDDAIETAFSASALPEEERVPFLQQAFQTWAMLGWFAQSSSDPA
jgi:hypothetical protein